MPDERVTWCEELKADALAVIEVIESKGFKFQEWQPDGSTRDITAEMLARYRFNVERLDKLIARSKAVPGSSGPLDIPNFGAV